MISYWNFLFNAVAGISNDERVYFILNDVIKNIGDSRDNVLLESGDNQVIERFTLDFDTDVMSVYEDITNLDIKTNTLRASIGSESKSSIDLQLGDDDFERTFLLASKT